MIQLNNYFYRFGDEYFVCDNKQDILYNKIKENNEDTLNIYKKIMKIISFIDSEFHNNNRELDSIISEVYNKIKAEIDAVATTDI